MQRDDGQPDHVQRNAPGVYGEPPKRRRLVLWVVIWAFGIQPLLQLWLRVAGLEAWALVLVLAAVTIAVFTPLVRAARTEFLHMRDQGLEPPVLPVTKKSVVAMALVAAMLWVGVVLYIAMMQEPVLPVFPIAVTSAALFKGKQRRMQLKAWRE
jgi:hypothetical protein